MLSISLHQAEHELSRLADVAAGGEDVWLIRNGRAVAKLTRITEGVAPQVNRSGVFDEDARRRRTAGLGLLKGKIAVPADIMDPLSDEDIELSYEGPMFPPTSSRSSPVRSVALLLAALPTASAATQPFVASDDALPPTPHE